MKRKAFLLLAISLLIISCKETKKENSDEVENTTETVDHGSHAVAAQELDNVWANDIVLNNGTKWQANKETTDGVEAMLLLINETNPSTIDDYKELGEKLNDVKNTVVEECTMKGPSHDNLHIWLYPLIKKIELLQHSETTTEGTETLTGITDNLNAYYTYFK